MTKKSEAEAERAARDAWHKYYDANTEMMERERIPRNPNIVYRHKGWKGWRDWIGPRNMKDITPNMTGDDNG